MIRFAPHAACVIGALIACAGMAHAQQVYRYLDADGKIVYSNQAPPATAKNIESKQLPVNTIETNPLSFEAQRAQERFPVTLYTFACGDACARAEALLKTRGVPYTTVVVTEAKGAEQLKKLTGDAGAPVLQAGDKMVAKGFNDTVWQTLLDNAGYPKTAPLRPVQPAVDVAKTAAAPPTAAPAGAPAASPKAPKAVAAPGGYPKD